MPHALAALLTVLVGFAFAPLARAQMPEKLENLQYFPKDISRDALVQRMREFSFALGVRCQYCHAGGDGISFEGVVFKSDEKMAKQKARFMLRMVDTINASVLAGVPGRREPPVRMDCVHCHRGSPIPRTLAEVMTEVIDSRGPRAAVERYRELRDNMAAGKYDFGEWSVNELARTLAERGNTDAAIVMLELNAEYHPKSAAIDLHLAELHRRRGETEKAIARYRLVLEKNPNDRRALQALKDLEAKR